MADTEALLEITGLTKRFGALTALDSADLVVAPGEVHCLLGENGAGKSTLCNLVFGVHAPDAGSMRFAGQPYQPVGPAGAIATGIAMVHQHFSLVRDLTVVENLLLGQSQGRLDRAAASAEIERVSREFGLAVEPGRLISELSVGERQRVEIVKCLVRRPRLVVLDEPTAVLPPGEVDSLLAVVTRMAASGCGVILVTHKLAEIARVARRCTVMRGGRVVMQADLAGTDMRELVRAMVGRDVRAVGSVAAAALELLPDAAEETSGMDTRGLEPEVAAQAPRRSDVLQIDNLMVRDRSGVLRVDNVSLTVAAGEIVGLAGVEGNGQSEIGMVLAGLLRPSAGRVFAGKTEITHASPRAITAAGVGIVPEDRHLVGCISALSITDNLLLGDLRRHSRFGFVQRARMRARARELMEKFDVRAASSEMAFSGMSGGNQQKAVLARELSLPNLNFLLAAQPTRGLDVGAVEGVYAHIRRACDAGVGVLLISSELDELLAVSSRVLVIYRGRIVGEAHASAANRDAIGAMMSGHAA